MEEILGSIYCHNSERFGTPLMKNCFKTIKAEKHDLGVVMRERKIGNLYGFTGGNYAGNVYEKNNLCPTINTCQGGGKQPMIIDTYNKKVKKGDCAGTITCHTGTFGACGNFCKVDKPKQLGFMDNGTGKHQSNTVYDEKGICPNITTIEGGGTQQIKIATADAIRMVRTEEGKKLRKQYENHEIHHGFNEFREPELRKDGVSNTLTSVQKDNMVCVQEALNPMEDETCRTLKGQYAKNSVDNFNLQTSFGASGVICAMRGRNPENPSDRTPGSPTEQRLEVNQNGTSNTLTSVQKDNLVMETVRIKQATKDGYIECELGGVADLSYPNSKTRRGRVQEGGKVCPTLTAQNQDICKIGQISSDGSQYGTVLSDNGLSSTLQAGTHGYANNCIATQYRIRKLTPRECWRLMDFSDADFEKAQEVNSNTQLYKQAGNSIVRNVLVAIFGQMIDGKEEEYKKLA